MKKQTKLPGVLDKWQKTPAEVKKALRRSGFQDHFPSMSKHLHCPKCSAALEDWLYPVAVDHGRGSTEMGRYDCPTKGCNTTVLVGQTSEMGDE